ncbi:efflux transporter outer membrane subunit [Sphingomonas sp. LHG3443-2]|uniref:efflux transporter outer membrane subunit n=1 Tax=Sphingomonas sp. LHG3443-2 TaxID=2804639 RepID=UPI003CF5143D
MTPPPARAAWFATLLLALLGGCAGPRPAIPPQAAVVAPPAWRTPLGPGAPIDEAWWGRFGDPALSALVERAISNNSDILAAAARVQEARAQTRLARSQLFPTLDGGASLSRSQSPSPLGGSSRTTTVQPAFQAAYEVDLFGRIRNDVAAARSNLLATQAAADAIRLSVASATASSYITLRALDARLAVVEATLASRAEALRIARDRAEVGYTSQLELRQAEAEYRSASQLVPQARLQIARQENALSLLTGDPPRAPSRGAALAALRQPAIPAGLPSDVLRRRPDIAEAENLLAAADASLSSTRAEFLPRVQLTGSLGLLLSSAIDPVTLWSVGGSVLAPILNGGRIRAQADIAAARRDQAAFAYRDTVLTAFREVEDNLAGVRDLAAQREEVEAQRVALAEALRHATNRYEAGYSSYLEQLDAQRALLNAELALIQVRADELNAYVGLYQALGGGWPGLPEI